METETEEVIYNIQVSLTQDEIETFTDALDFLHVRAALRHTYNLQAVKNAMEAWANKVQWAITDD